MGAQKTFSAKQALKIANNAAAKGDKEKAIKYFEAVLAKYPDNEEAIEGFKKLHPNSLFRNDIEELGELFKSGEYREVEVKSKMYLEIYPDVHELRSLLGAALASRGENEEALIHFKKAAELTPFIASAQFNLGNAYKANAELEKAAESYKRAIDLDADYAQAYNNLGNLYHEIGELDKAEPMFEKARQLQPKTI